MNAITMQDVRTSQEAHALNVLNAALNFATLGFPVFPIVKNGKIPAIKAWKENATRDPAQIRKWFGKNGTHSGYNLGGATGYEIKDPQTGTILFVSAIDIDNKNGKEGEKSLKQACEKLGLNLANHINTRIHGTPSGGEHLFYKHSQPIKQGVDVLGEGSGVDIRSLGGYVVLPPSTIDGKPYTVKNGVPVAPLGDLANLVTFDTRKTKTAKAKALGRVDPARAEVRGKEYLLTAPIAIQGQGGNNTTFKVAAKLKDFVSNKDQALNLMIKHWNSRCSPPWTLDELDEIVQNAFGYGRNQVGSSAPEVVFAEFIQQEENKDAAKHPLAKINEQHAFITIGGAGYILWEKKGADGRDEIEFLTIPTFNNLLAATKLQTGDRARPITQEWMEWPERRTYHGMRFSPCKSLPSEYLNLWRGFGVEPKQGHWSLMRGHIRNVICGGDQQLDAYVIGWLARAVQRPDLTGEVALVLRGQKGTGKGTLGKWMKRIFGRHGRQVSNPVHLTGRFNSHLMGCAFLFADEAFFAGNKQDEGVLKALITEPYLQIELKGKDVIESDNCLHILMASNNDWVIPASADERRYCVIDVSNRHKGDLAYFNALLAESGSGGLEAMLYDLQAYDLTGFEVRRVPATKAMDDQKVASLKSTERWIYDLMTGASVGDLLGVQWQENGCHINKLRAYGDYTQKCKALYHDTYPAKPAEFWKRIKSLFGETVKEYRPAGGEREVILPPLSEGRIVLSKSLGISEVHFTSEDGQITTADNSAVMGGSNMTAESLFD